MQELYNCKQIDSKHYKITKFDNHLNPKRDHTGRTSSYVVSELGCDCPQGHAKSCRHRKMLPFFLEHEYVNSEYFFVWDTHQWYKAPAPVREAREESLLAAAREMLVQPNPFNPFNSPTTTDENWHVPEGKWRPIERSNIHNEIIDEMLTEGGQKPASAAPSPQPSSKVYRRF